MGQTDILSSQNLSGLRAYLFLTLHCPRYPRSLLSRAQWVLFHGECRSSVLLSLTSFSIVLFCLTGDGLGEGARNLLDHQVPWWGSGEGNVLL